MSRETTADIRTVLASCDAWKALNQHVIRCQACRTCAPCMAGDLLLSAARELEAAATASGHVGGPLHD